jgi:hypothetical protein
MPKIPVVATVVAAYRYIFANYLRLFGIAWASTLLLMAIMLGLFMPLILGMEQGLLNGDPAAALRAVGPLLLFEVVGLLLVLIPVVGITRQVFGRPVTWPYFYLAIGGDFWRLVLACVIIGLILIGVTLAVSLPLSILAGMTAATSSGTHPDPVALQAQMRAYQPIIVIPIYLATLFVSVRLGFFLPSIVVEERSLGIGRNWTLTRGNSWRILAVIVLILLPLILIGAIQFVAFAALGGPNYFDIFGPPPAPLKVGADFMRIYLQYWYLYGAAWLLLYPVIYGPILVASAHAYRAIAGDAPSAQD